MSEVSISAARKALDGINDCARMPAAIDPAGPRGVLEQFITDVERAQAAPERPAPDDLFDLIREWAHLPEGQRGDAARAIIGYVNRSHSAGVADGRALGALETAPAQVAAPEGNLPQPFAGAVTLLETIAVHGSQAKFDDGSATPNALLCQRFANELKSYAAASQPAPVASDLLEAPPMPNFPPSINLAPLIEHRDAIWAERVRVALGMQAALLEYFQASVAFNNSHGDGPDGEALEQAVERERKAEERFDVATQAAHAAMRGILSKQAASTVAGISKEAQAEWAANMHRPHDYQPPASTAELSDERAAFEALQQELAIARAFTRTPKVEPDVMPPTSGSTPVAGYLSGRGGEPEPAWTNSVYHGYGAITPGVYRSGRQNPRRLYSTPLLALKAYRNTVEEDAAKALARIDTMIADLEGGA